MEIELFYAEPRIERDLADIVALIKILSPDRVVTPEDVFKTALTHTVLVRRSEHGRIIATATLVRNDVNGKTTGRIEDVVTHEKYRGQGIGGALMAKAIWFARESGFDLVDLTSRKGRADARKLYRALGFKRRDTNVYRLEL